MLARILRAIETTDLFHLVNLIVAGVWVYFITAQVTKLQTLSAPYYVDVHGVRVDIVMEIRIVTILQLTMNSMLIIFYVFRRRAKDEAGDPLSLLLGHLGTWLPLAFAPPERDPGAVPTPDELARAAICDGVMVLAIAVAALGFVSLGRSWGIIPANRGVRTGGLYRLVRHPIYASYIVFWAAFVVAQPSTRNALIVLAFVPTLYARAVLEERVLRRDPEYSEYARRTRSMLIPGIL